MSPFPISSATSRCSASSATLRSLAVNLGRCSSARMVLLLEAAIASSSWSVEVDGSREEAAFVVGEEGADVEPR